MNTKKNTIEPLNEPIETNQRLSYQDTRRHSYLTESKTIVTTRNSLMKTNGSPIDLHKIDRPSLNDDILTHWKKVEHKMKSI